VNTQDILVSAEWLAVKIEDPMIIPADCRFVMGAPDAGEAAYRERHIPGAVYFDLERDLSGPVQRRHGGRHPLPSVEHFTEVMERAGIGSSHTIVAYDDQGGAMASRLWWLLRAMGHARVFVLDIPFSVWMERGHPTNALTPVRERSTFAPKFNHEMVVEMEEVRSKLHSPEVTLLDSREPVRYRGEHEPLDPIAGHIPSARNLFWRELLDERGAFRSRDEIAAHFSSVPRDQEVIVYCGSGVTACPNVLALTALGYPRVRLYAGSWSDWCSHPENPIELGEVTPHAQSRL
jgi:thiosulfate/3-mercaptopyruvate sulfurtransferase